MEASTRVPSPPEALAQLQQYLADALDPTQAAGAVDVLARAHPSATAAAVVGWAEGQPGVAGLVERLLDAARKIHLLAEIQLLPEDRVLGLLGGLFPYLLAACPEADRTRFRTAVARLARPRTPDPLPGGPVLAPPAAPPLQPGAAPARGSVPEASPQALHRLALLIERLESAPRGSGAGAPSVPPELAAQLLAASVAASRDEPDLAMHLDRLKRRGLDVSLSDVFRRLRDSLPDWGLLPAPSADDSGCGGTVPALLRLVSIARDPGEGTRRFAETVQAAVEAHNAGALARSATLLALADQVARTGQVDWATVTSVRAEAHHRLSPERLKASCDSPVQLALFRRVLEFFPGLLPLGLLEALKGEKRRDVRRQLLSLLEVHGGAAREVAYSQLKETVNEVRPADWFFQRNLLTVLRRIPRAAPGPGDGEVEALFRLTEPTQPAPLVKEALANLGQLKSRRSEQILAGRLAQLESALAKGGIPAEAASESQQLLDRVASSLAEQGTPSALRAVAEHGLKVVSALGDTHARLQVLGACDLSFDAELVERLVRTLRAALPVKVLGFVSQSAGAEAGKLVAALAGTPAVPVRRVLDEVARKFGDQELGRAAAKVLRAFDAPKRPTEPVPQGGVAGALALHGLPSLLQALELGRATGILTLKGGDGAIVATVALEEGRLRGCAAGRRTGVAALFELVERPVPVSFELARRAALRPEEATLGAADLTALLLEGVRRHELRSRGTVLVADGDRFRATSQRPTRPADVVNKPLLVEVWGMAVAGKTALECEESVAVDRYHVRHALLHWLLEGSLARG